VDYAVRIVVEYTVQIVVDYALHIVVDYALQIVVEYAVQMVVEYAVQIVVDCAAQIVFCPPSTFDLYTHQFRLTSIFCSFCLRDLDLALVSILHTHPVKSVCRQFVKVRKERNLSGLQFLWQPNEVG
jgi:hypothetical protein